MKAKTGETTLKIRTDISRHTFYNLIIFITYICILYAYIWYVNWILSHVYLSEICFNKMSKVPNICYNIF